MNLSTVKLTLARGFPGQGRPWEWRAGICALLLGVILVTTSSVTGHPPSQGQPPAPPLRLFGQVTLGGNPAPDGTVVLASISGATVTKSTLTDGGSYSINVPSDDPNTGAVDGGVDGATITLYVGGSTGYTGDPGTYQIAFESGGVPPSHNLAVPATAVLDITLGVSPSQPVTGQQVTFSGTVKDMAGSLVTGATVSASWADGSQNTQAVTGANGSFSLGHVYSYSGGFVVLVNATKSGLVPDTLSQPLVVNNPSPPTPTPTTPSGGGGYIPPYYPTSTPTPQGPPTPTDTPWPTPTLTPTPTATPRATPTPTATPATVLTTTPVATATPAAIPATTTPQPTSPPSPTAAQSPTATAIPVASPTPTVPTTTPLPSPTASPIPTAAPTPPVGAPVRVSGLTLSQSVAAAGVPVATRFTIANPSNRAIDYSVDIFVNGTVYTTLTGSLSAGASRTLSANIVRSQPGLYTVAVQGLVDSFSILPAQIGISRLEVSPTIVGPGDPVNISAWVTNQGGSPGSYNVIFIVAGNAEASFTGTLPAGSSKPLALQVRREEPGTYSVSVSESAGQFIVLAPLLDMGIPRQVLIGSDTTQATDTAGNILATTGSTTNMQQDESGEIEVVLPVALNEGAHLSGLRDAASGITLVDNRIRIPILDAQGREAMTIVADVDSTTGTGTSARVKLNKQSLKLEVPEKSVDMSGANPAVGQVSVGITARLNHLPDQARLSVVAKETLSPDARSGFELLAQETDSTIASVGAAVEVTRTNLANGTDIGAVTLRISVGALWVQQHGGIDQIRIARRGDDGSRQFLPTTFIGEDVQGQMVFEGLSEQGFSIFSILAVAPKPEIEFHSLTIQPQVIAPGEAAEVTVDVANVGTAATTSAVMLRLNGEPYDSKNISLEPGASTTLSFLLTREQTGTYQVEVGGLTKALEVAQALSAAQVTATAIRVSPEQVNAGEAVTVTVTITNTGGQAGKLDVPLMLNGVLVQLAPVLVPSGETAEVTFTLVPQGWGSYTIGVLNVEGSLEVVRLMTPASLAVQDLRVTPSKVGTGEPVTVTFSAVNTGEQAGTLNLALMVNGEVERSIEIALEGLTSAPQSLQVVRDEPGQYMLTLEGLSARFEVTGGAEPSVQPTATATPQPVEEPGRNWLPIVMAAVLASLAAAGGAAAWFLAYRRRRNAGS